MEQFDFCGLRLLLSSGYLHNIASKVTSCVAPVCVKNDWNLGRQQTTTKQCLCILHFVPSSLWGAAPHQYQKYIISIFSHWKKKQQPGSPTVPVPLLVCATLCFDLSSTLKVRADHILCLAMKSHKLFHASKALAGQSEIDCQSIMWANSKLRNPVCPTLKKVVALADN